MCEHNRYDGRMDKRHEPVEERTPLEYRCFECSKEGHYGCSCCANNLCFQHHETQAGFCSRFETRTLKKHTEVHVVHDRANAIKRADVRIEETQIVTGCFLEHEERRDEVVVFQKFDDGGLKSCLDMDKAVLVD